MLTDFKDEDFDSKIKNEDVSVIQFSAAWCGPCKSLGPILEEISNDLKDQLKVVKVNLDENQDLAMKYSIRSIPTLLLFKGGELIDTKVGLLPKSDLVEWLDSKI